MRGERRLKVCGAGAAIGCAAFLGGCTQYLIDSTDRQVYDLIRQRQAAALGATSKVDIRSEDGHTGSASNMYNITPRPIGAELPSGFGTKDQAPTQEPTEEPTQEPSEAAPVPAAGDAEMGDDPADEPPQTEPAQDAPEPDSEQAPADAGAALISPDIFPPDQLDRVMVFKLSDALAYAAENARSLRDAKEDIYLSALDLTLERHLWTPQWVASISEEFADFGQVRKFDRAMTAISDVSISQRLPYGGDVTARIINRLMRDLGRHVTSGESGDLILSANIPLFRNAGRVAYESRYQAERSLIYAVRTFERFRRSFLVDIAGDYFDLQQTKARVSNAYTSYLSRRESWERAESIHGTPKSRSVDDAPRARSSLRNAETALVSAKESYETALDRFKVRIAMEVDAPLDVIDQADDVESAAVEGLLPTADEKQAVAVALRYRLDLLTDADQVDDARRGVVIAKNQILPDLDFNGSVTMASDPNRLDSTSFNTERTTWRGIVQLRMDDRKAERNDYRASLVRLRRRERDHEEFMDTVRSDVRRGMRRIRRQRDIREIQELNVEENVFRHAAATARYDLGKSTNQDVVDADEDLLRARNDLAGAVADFRLAILEFRRDSGSLRINFDGSWIALPLTDDDGP